jgi:dipeptidyl aminopeptidase/acylaminoacyl peptidase
MAEALDGSPSTRICQVDLNGGELRVLTFGPHSDRSPRYSPDGCRVAFLSERHGRGDWQLYLLDLRSGRVSSAPRPEGWVEYFHWAPDGSRILLGVAERGADLAGLQGGAPSATSEAPAPWMPLIEANPRHQGRRYACIYDVQAGSLMRADVRGRNLWEAVWCGRDTLAAICSDGAGEGDWYRARLETFSLSGGTSQVLHTPRDQLGWLAVSPSGQRVAVVEAVCSDRYVVAGALLLVDRPSGAVVHVDTRGTDVTYLEWRSEDTLLIAGHRGFESAVMVYRCSSSTLSPIWSSTEVNSSARFLTVAGFNEAGDFAMIGEGYLRSPEVAVIERGQYRIARSFDLGYVEAVTPLMKPEPVVWEAPDGLEIQGWLLRPPAKEPAPLILSIHGGPIWHSRPTWLGRNGAAVLMLLARGYAVFYPNPRGSTGRGQAFARRVVGDMGGADALDCLSGIDHLVRQGIADAKRLGVTGGSYGGFMTSWLIAHDARFRAAVPMSPTINMVTQYLLSNIPDFVSLFMGEPFTASGGAYAARSPIVHAHNVKTPTLNICGALDRCTPPEEAMQFHRALCEREVPSVLLTYPQEGHGVRKYPAAIDIAARIVAWFAHYV